MNARSGAVVAVIALVVLAGCSGLIDREDSGTASSETLTPVPVPEDESTLHGVDARSTTPSRYQGLRPTCERPPGLVVAIQLGALRTNDPQTNDGINTTWRFAAPSNRAAIGSYERFVNIITEQYRPLLDAETMTLGRIDRSNTTARQPVTVTTVTDETRSYVWYLKRQTGGRYEGCWMTTGVRASLDVEE